MPKTISLADYGVDSGGSRLRELAGIIHPFVGRQQANADSAGTSVSKTQLIDATRREPQSLRLRRSGNDSRDLVPAYVNNPG